VLEAPESGGSVACVSSDPPDNDAAGGDVTGAVPPGLPAPLARPGWAQATSAANATDSATEPASADRVSIDTRLTAASRSQPADFDVMSTMVDPPPMNSLRTTPARGKTRGFDTRRPVMASARAVDVRP
jgi:hypothetical protein